MVTEYTCPSGWSLHDDRCYKLHETPAVDYDDADSRCRSDGAQLACVVDEAENDFLKSLL